MAISRSKHFRWKLLHAAGILAHLGLATAAAISYVFELSRDGHAAAWSQYLVANANANACSFPLVDSTGTWVLPDVATRMLLLTCVVVGTLGLAINAALFHVLMTVEANDVTLTEGEQHWRRQLVTFFGCVLNLLLAGAGVGLAVASGTKTARSRTLIAPLVWASIQAQVALAMAAADAVKVYREGQDLLD